MNSSDNGTWRKRATKVVLLLAVTALAAYLRLRTLAADDLWLDEVYTLTYGSRPVAALWLAPGDPTPPLYYTLHHLLIGFSNSPALIRSISAGAGILTIPAMYALGRSIHSTATGLAAALFLAVCGPHIEYSQEARAYALLFLLIVLSAVCLSETLRRREQGESGEGRAFAALIFFCVLAVYTHYVALFWLAAVYLVLITYAALHLPGAPPLVRIASGAVWSAVAVAPALWMMGKFSGWSRLIPHRFEDFLGLLSDIVLVREPWPGSEIAAAFLLAMGLCGAVFAVRQARPAAVICAFFLFSVLLWQGQALKPVLMFRTALVSVVGALLLFSVAAASIRRSAGLAAALATAGVLAGSHLAYERSDHRAYDWAAVAEKIEARGRDGDVIILCVAMNHPPLRYYLDEEVTIPFAAPMSSGKILKHPAPADDAGQWHQFYAELSLRYASVLTRMSSPAALAAEQAPGSRGWVVEAQCGDERRKALDRLLAAMELTPTQVWQGRGVRLEVVEF